MSLPLQLRLDQNLSDDTVTTIITYDEQMRGWLSYAARAKTQADEVYAYARLKTNLETFRGVPVLPFDAQAATHFARLRDNKIRIGTMDLKIAAICLAQDATLLTRHLRDFGRVPGLRAEDWSV